MSHEKTRCSTVETATRTESWSLNQTGFYRKEKQRKSLFHETLNWFHLTVSNQLKQYLAPSILLLCCIKSHSHVLQPVVSASKSLGWESHVSDGGDNTLPLALLHYQSGLPCVTLVTLTNVFANIQGRWVCIPSYTRVQQQEMFKLISVWNVIKNKKISF